MTDGTLGIKGYLKIEMRSSKIKGNSAGQLPFRTTTRAIFAPPKLAVVVERGRAGRRGGN